jgi:hypothetical protein
MSKTTNAITERVSAYLFGLPTDKRMFLIIRLFWAAVSIALMIVFKKNYYFTD